MTRFLLAASMFAFPALAIAWVELPRLLANLRDRAEFRVIDERERVNRALARSRKYPISGWHRHLPDGSTAFHSNLLARGGATFAEETRDARSMPAAPSAPRATGGAAGLLGS